jgi:hypothetical protein
MRNVSLADVLPPATAGEQAAPYLMATSPHALMVGHLTDGSVKKTYDWLAERSVP